MSATDEDIVDAEVVSSETSIVKKEEAPVEAWTWDKKKRVAFRMMLEGHPHISIAKHLGVHRNTIRNWSRTPEWLAEMRARIAEKQTATKLRRLSMTDEAIEKLNERFLSAVEPNSEMGPKMAAVFIKELREFIAAERKMYGEAAGPGTPSQNSPVVNINLPGSGTTGLDSQSSATTDTMSFKALLQAHNAPVDASNLQDGMVAKAREILLNTDVLDRIREEDKAQEKIDAVSKDAKRK